LNECNDQMNSLLAGLASVVPLNLFCLYTPEEMDYLICGQPDFAISELKNNAE